MNRRDLLLGLLCAGMAAVFIVAANIDTGRERSGSSSRDVDAATASDHLTVRYEADGQLSLGSPPELVVTLPDARQTQPIVWDEALTKYKRAVIARFGRRGFGPGEYREGSSLTIHAPAQTPWRVMTWLMYPAGDPALRVPTIRLLPVGRDSVTLHLPQDPGHTDAYVMDPPHIHVDDDRVAVYAGGVIAEVGWIYVDPDDAPKGRYRASSLAPERLGGLREAVRVALLESESWAGGCAALTWPSECSVPLERMTDVLRRVLDAGPTTLYLASLDPDDTHGR